MGCFGAHQGGVTILCGGGAWLMREEGGLAVEEGPRVNGSISRQTPGRDYFS